MVENCCIMAGHSCFCYRRAGRCGVGRGRKYRTPLLSKTAHDDGPSGVQGGKLEVLASAQRLIESARPTVICEVVSEHAQEVSAFFRSRGHELCDGGCADGGAPAGPTRPLDDGCDPRMRAQRAVRISGTGRRQR